METRQKYLFGFQFLCSCVLFLSLATGVHAQSKQDHFHDADGNFYHQVFLDFKAVSILEIYYPSDGQCIDGTLSGDGFSVIIRNYPGDRSVRVKAVDQAGHEHEVTRSRCYIDPVLLEL